MIDGYVMRTARRSNEGVNILYWQFSVDRPCRTAWLRDKRKRADIINTTCIIRLTCRSFWWRIRMERRRSTRLVLSVDLDQQRLLLVSNRPSSFSWRSAPVCVWSMNIALDTTAHLLDFASSSIVDRTMIQTLLLLCALLFSCSMTDGMPKPNPWW